ncbi:hypothetical protein LTR53_016650, partial [Teratosphaeriaceae sp. CCFEE 6253]
PKLPSRHFSLQHAMANPQIQSPSRRRQAGGRHGPSSTEASTSDQTLPGIKSLGLLDLSRHTAQNMTVPDRQYSLTHIPASHMPTIQSHLRKGRIGDCPSPPTSDESRSATPASSRGPSTEPMTSKRKASVDDKCEIKKRKEKEARKNFGNLHVDVEDALALAIDFRAGKAQTAGNGASAGLSGDKRETMQASAALLDKLMAEKLREARREDALIPPRPGHASAVQRVKAEMLAIAQQGARSGDPFRGSMMDDGRGVDATRCERAPDGSKACSFHGRDDYRKCRLDSRGAIYEQNKRAESQYRADTVASKRQGRGPPNL